MCTLAGPDACVAFTHLSSAAAAALSSTLPSTSSSTIPANTEVPGPACASCHEEGVLALMQARGTSLERVCLLDPKAPEALSPSDGGDAGGFAWFLFGVRTHSPSLISASVVTRCCAQGILGMHMCSIGDGDVDAGVWTRRRPASGPDCRAACARLPDASFGLCADDDGHCAWCDEARCRRSRFVSCPRPADPAMGDKLLTEFCL